MRWNISSILYFQVLSFPLSWIKQLAGKTIDCYRKYYPFSTLNKTMKSKNFKNGKKSQSNFEYIKIIFFTKYNRHVLKDKISSRTKQFISEVLLNLNCRIYKIHIKPNYVLLIIGKPVKLETPRLMGRVKSISSVQLRREFPELVEQCKKALWAGKYRILD